jgi:hypothetical protein
MICTHLQSLNIYRRLINLYCKEKKASEEEGRKEGRKEGVHMET